MARALIVGRRSCALMPSRKAASSMANQADEQRRIITILFLLFPSLLTSPSFLAFLRSPATSSSNTALLHDRHRHPHHLDSSSAVRPSLSDRLKRLWHLSSILKWRHRLADLIESPLGQSMPELHMVAFLYGGRFFEWGRRLTGMGYVSVLSCGYFEEEKPVSGCVLSEANRRSGYTSDCKRYMHNADRPQISTLPPSNRKTTSFEPLALLLAIPLIFRLLPRRSLSTELTDSTPRAVSKALDPSLDPDIELDTSSHLHPAAGTSSPDQTADAAGGSILVGPKMLYDTPNTYLLSSAQELPERQCTLCLEPRGTGEGSGGTVGVTECGHVFCWGCLGGLEKVSTGLRSCHVSIFERTTFPTCLDLGEFLPSPEGTIAQ